MIDRTHLLYRPCVGIFLLNQERKIFVGERIDTQGAWQMPQGGIDEDEDIHVGAMRELAEEIGTNKAEIIMTAPEKLKYELPDHLIKNHWNGKYRGQEQTWIAARYLGNDEDINLNAHHPPEFSAWKWIKPQDCLDLIVPFKRELYKDVLRQFASLY